MLETGGDFTYKPSINKVSKSMKSDQPAHIRLIEKGKEYQSLLEEKKKEATIYDSNGRKLFLPQRYLRKAPMIESEMDVDEYLYRDAQVKSFFIHSVFLILLTLLLVRLIFVRIEWKEEN